jgi:hypothetical protein
VVPEVRVERRLRVAGILNKADSLRALTATYPRIDDEKTGKIRGYEESFLLRMVGVTLIENLGVILNENEACWIWSRGTV